MKYWALSSSIGILAGIWTYVSTILGILTWPAFIGWAIFFFAGGDESAIKKSLLPMFSGILLGYLAVLAYVAIGGGTLALAILVAIIAFIMTFQLNFPPFALCPASFAACAAFFGAGDPIRAGLPLIIGLFLGLLSAKLPDLIKSESKQKTA